MIYRTSSFEQCFVVRWLASPTVDGIQAVTREVVAVHHTLGKPILYIAIVGAAVPPPGTEAREAFNRQLPEMGKVCERIDIVIEGSDLGSRMNRTIVRAMSLTSRRAMKVFATLSEAAQDWHKAYGVDAAALVAKVQADEARSS